MATIIFADTGILLDGQHRLQACIDSGVTIISNVVRGIKESAFYTIDQGSNRTSADIFAIEQIPNYAKVSSCCSFYVRMHHGLVFSNNRASLKSMRISKKDLLDLYKDNKELIVWAQALSSRCYDKLHLLAESEIGGIICFLAKDRNHKKDVIEAFFIKLFSNDLSSSSIVVLRNKLINNLASSKRMTLEHKLSIIAKSWNAYMSGKQLKILSWNKDNEGIIDFKEAKDEYKSKIW